MLPLENTFKKNKRQLFSYFLIYLSVSKLQILINVKEVNYLIGIIRYLLTSPVLCDAHVGRSFTFRIIQVRFGQTRAAKATLMSVCTQRAADSGAGRRKRRRQLRCLRRAAAAGQVGCSPVRVEPDQRMKRPVCNPSAEKTHW